MPPRRIIRPEFRNLNHGQSIESLLTTGLQPAPWSSSEEEFVRAHFLWKAARTFLQGEYRYRPRQFRNSGLKRL